MCRCLHTYTHVFNAKVNRSLLIIKRSIHRNNKFSIYCLKDRNKIKFINKQLNNRFKFDEKIKDH